MPVSKLALGMNARNYLYIRPNNRRGAKKRADNKLLTKRRLVKNDVPTPKLIAQFHAHREVRSFDWSSLKGSFVLKPARGYGGSGITVVRDWNGTEGRRLGGGHPITLEELEAEIFSIIDGAYSLDNLPDLAFLEARVTVAASMRKLAKRGVPDLRIIVYNKVPIMAMLRLPTSYSHGKANLHQGAMGIGIDMRTGITTKSVLYGEEEEFIPGTKTKVRGIKIPRWNKVLKIAVAAQECSRLGFAGIDIVLDEERGPLVLETNARPGLQIQLANGDSLRTRLERIEGMSIPSADYGIELARRLFAESALTEIPDTEHILNVIEKVTIVGPNGKKVVQAKIDTGAYSTSVDESLVHELGLEEHDETKRIRSGVGEELRSTVKFVMRIRGKDIETVASYTDRAHMTYPMIVGRCDIKGFLVDPAKAPDEAF